MESMVNFAKMPLEKSEGECAILMIFRWKYG